MYQRLYNLWFVDGRSRARLYVTSAVVAFVYGIVNDILLNRPEERVTWETLVVLCVIVMGWTAVYCTRAEQKTVRARHRSLSAPATPRAVLVSALAVAIIIGALVAYVYVSPEYVPPPNVEYVPPPNVPPSVELIQIKSTIQKAEVQNRILPSSQLAAYKSRVRSLPRSTADYWPTVAAIVNYQSLVNQKSGKAPDPSKVAKPCFGYPGNQNVYNNTFNETAFPNCIVYIDRNTFVNVTFQNSVVHYQGGPVALYNVKFVNCRFFLDISQSTPPARPELLLAILNSPNQESVEIRDLRLSSRLKDTARIVAQKTQ